jgi:lysine 2,3-aminomutase
MTPVDLNQLMASIECDRQGSKCVAARLPMRVSPHYLELIQGPDDPIAKQVVPDVRELEDTTPHPDPLREESQAPAAQIIHRYPHRVIFLVSNQCAVYCRFCMRKRRIDDAAQVPADALQEGIDYIANTPEINEVILSGGDPLTLPDQALEGILQPLHRMPHVRVLRIHTRIPNAWPQRITPSLAKRLARFHPLYVNIHFNHPDEITAQAREACARLADAGIPLGSQTVLLRDVNDHPQTLIHLFQSLLEIRVRPYYLHQLDRVPGTAHFRVPMEKAIGLMDALRGRLSGQAMPHFMVDLPGGGGKVELVPESPISRNKGEWVFRNFQGRLFTYPLDQPFRGNTGVSKIRR